MLEICKYIYRTEKLSPPLQPSVLRTRRCGLLVEPSIGTFGLELSGAGTLLGFMSMQWKLMVSLRLVKSLEGEVSWGTMSIRRFPPM
ncbi:hypothetical protein D9758_016417 [Tetrapyrgos nigripes]|uniref:Uncharacterized protein n=1 Tax=Tetrapyrgos nigripes TaxID=182062 RepID=A0A8H5FPT0_9AGAR|nr:hypothetical protein D9758_016417 [Tetrapyrgos nigripes]